MRRLIEYSSIRPLPTFAQSSAQTRGVFSGDYSMYWYTAHREAMWLYAYWHLLITIAITTTTVMSITPSYKHLSFGI